MVILVNYSGKMSSVFDMSLSNGNQEVFNTDANLNIVGFGVMLAELLFESINLILSLLWGFFDLITLILKHPVAPSYYDLAWKITFDLDNKNKISFAGFSYID